MKEFRVPRADKSALPFKLIYDKFVPSESGLVEHNGIKGDWVETDEQFSARGQIPGNLLISLTASMNSGVGVQAHELQRMLATALVEEDRERFIKTLDDADTAVPIQMLGEITEWLAEEYAGRPT